MPAKGRILEVAPRAKPALRYAYEVAGETYQGERYSYVAGLPPDFSQPEGLVEVYHHPQQPQHAVLDRRAPTWADLLSVKVFGAAATSLCLILIPFWLGRALRDSEGASLSTEDPRSPTGI